MTAGQCVSLWRIAGRRSWEKMGINGTFSKGTRFLSRSSTTKCFGVGSAMVARRKSLLTSFLRRQTGTFSLLSSPANRAVESSLDASSSIAKSHAADRRGLATSRLRSSRAPPRVRRSRFEDWADFVAHVRAAARPAQVVTE